MAWTLYTPELADALLGPGEMAAITKHLALDARANVLSRQIAKVRGYCAARGELGADGTIPPECEDALASLYRYALLACLPVSSLMTTERTEEKKSADNFLKDVAAGKVGISRPDPVSTTPDELSRIGPVSPSINRPPARALQG